MMSDGNPIAGAQILIVEDSPTQSMLLQHLLEREGYRVTAAASGKQALEELSKFMPAVIISDIVMPEMDGFELSRAIKSNERLRDIPVDTPDCAFRPGRRDQGNGSLVDFYLTKPYDEDFLLSKVESIMDRPAVPRKNNGLQTLNVNLWGKTHDVSVVPELSLSLLAPRTERHPDQSTIAERNRRKKRVEEELRVTVKRLKEMESIIEISPAVAFVRRADEKWPIEFVSDNVLQFDYESRTFCQAKSPISTSFTRTIGTVLPQRWPNMPRIKTSKSTARIQNHYRLRGHQVG